MKCFYRCRVHSGNVLVMGDFNYPQIDWENGRVEGPEMSSQVQFYDTIQDLFWVQHVNFHTKIQGRLYPIPFGPGFL